MPFSDPIADGPTIQKSSEYALAAGVTLRKILDFVTKIREKTDIPTLLFSSINPLLKFGLEELEYNERTCIIIAEVHGKTGTILVGMVVDAVSEVLNVTPEDIEAPPAFGNDREKQIIKGMAKTESGVRILLDTQRLLKQEEAEMLDGYK